MLRSSYNPKIKIIHLLSKPEDEREKTSIEAIKQLNFEYVQHINPPYTGDFPKNGVPFDHLNPAVYGCFQAHRRAFEEFTDDVDFLMVCECDCIPRLPPRNFEKAIVNYAKIITTRGLACLSVGGTGAIGEITEGVYICKIVTSAHCLLYPKNKKSIILDGFKNLQWCAFDIWISQLLGPKKLIAVTEKRIAIQADGVSIISNTYKKFDWSQYGLGEV